MQFIEFLKSLLQEPTQFHNTIRAGRISKEKQLCEQEVEWRTSENSDIVVFYTYSTRGEIVLNQMYPFYQPQIQFIIDDDYYTVANYEDKNDYDYYFKTLKWTPGLTINQIIKKQESIKFSCQEFMGKKLIQKKPYSLDPYSDCCNKLRNFGGSRLVICFIFMVVFLINMLITFTDYANYQKYMVKLISSNNWYKDSLKMAPFKAYFFYFIALIVGVIDQNNLFPQLNTQLNLPFYHYLNVIINISCFYIPTYFIFKNQHIKLNKNIQNGILFYLLTSPTVLGVWNITECKNKVNVALLIVALATLQQSIWIGSVMFLILLNYEPQMLFYSPIAIVFVLGRLCKYHGVISTKTIKPNFKKIHRVFLEGGLIFLVLLIVQAFTLFPFIFNNTLGEMLNSLVLYNSNIGMFRPIGLIIILIPSLVLAFLSEKYLSLSFLATTAYLILFNLTTEIRIQAFSVLLMLNYKYLQILINNIIFALPQPNKFYQLLYFIFGELFTRRNRQVIKQNEESKLDQLIKLLSAVSFILIQVQICLIWLENEIITNFIYFVVLIACFKQIYEKIVKMVRKRKVD